MEEKKDLKDVDLSNLITKNEGTAKFLTYRPEDYSDGGKALKKSMPVFYNPVQEINRSISNVVYKAFLQIQSDNPKMIPFSICDSMAASGIRSIRMAKFLDPSVNIITNDLNPLALQIIKKNAKLNDISPERFQLTNEDAIFLFAKMRKNRNFQTIIDIDPFGTPNVFIDSAIQATRNHGMLAITATDTMVLFGVKPDACFRKYNTKSLRSTFLKEIGLRILLYFTAIRAHPHGKHIKPLLSLSFDHYIRVFVQINRGKEGVKENHKNLGYVLWCPTCDWRQTIDLDITKSQESCPLCHGKLVFGGPLWIGNLHDKEFVQECNKALDQSELTEIPSKKRLQKVLLTVENEDKFPVGFYDLHKICDKLGISVKKTSIILDNIREAGFQAGLTHIEHRAIKSNIPIEKLKQILLLLETH